MCCSRARPSCGSAERAWVGADVGGALRLAIARGCDLAVRSELLPAEFGLVEAERAERSSN
jgi:hypothetical protein